MTDHQPNFNALFYETIGPASHPIRYAIRQGPNCVHDLIFVSSLTHDARILNPDAKPHDGKFEIRLNRDCWELGDTDIGGHKELHIADSQLCFTAVKSVHWHFDKQLTHDPWLDYLWIDREVDMIRMPRSRFTWLAFTGNARFRWLRTTGQFS
jgi:hypothetical protein